MNDFMEEDENMNTQTRDDGLPAEPANAESSGGAASKNAHWYDSLSEEIRNNPNITKFKDAESLAKSYIEASKKLGMKGIQPLPDDATREQRAAYNSMRRGEKIKTPEDYSFEKDNQAEWLKSLKKTLFDAGADDYMATEILSKMKSSEESDDNEMLAVAEKTYQAEAERLRAEWGEDYLVNRKANDILLSKYPEAEKTLRALGADKMFGIQMMLHHLNRLSGDTEIKLSQARSRSFDDRMREIESSEAYKHSWHKDHQAAVSARTDLILEMARQGRK